MEFGKRHFVSLSLLIVSTVATASLTDIPLFLLNAFKKPHVVGAVLPCMSGVGKELTRYVVQSQDDNPSRPLNILEVGAGTGAMTEVVIANLRDIDHLDVIEISPEFCEVLHEKFDKHPNVSIHCLSIIDWRPESQYDFIISTLPFNSFDYDLMDSIINHLTTLIKHDGMLSYVAYTGIAQIRKPFLWGKKRADHTRKMKRLKQWRSQYMIAEKTILKNVPPINVYHLQITNDGCTVS